MDGDFGVVRFDRVEGYRGRVEWGKVRVSCGRYLRGSMGANKPWENL
ncbi:hypothetical protein Tco_1234792, partial [Tanacetum coccineum]